MIEGSLRRPICVNKDNHRQATSGVHCAGDKNNRVIMLFGHDRVEVLTPVVFPEHSRVPLPERSNPCIDVEAIACIYSTYHDIQDSCIIFE